MCVSSHAQSSRPRCQRKNASLSPRALFSLLPFFLFFLCLFFLFCPFLSFSFASFSTCEILFPCYGFTRPNFFLEKFSAMGKHKGTRMARWKKNHFLDSQNAMREKRGALSLSLSDCLRCQQTVWWVRCAERKKGVSPETLVYENKAKTQVDDVEKKERIKRGKRENERKPPILAEEIPPSLSLSLD